MSFIFFIFSFLFVDKVSNITWICFSLLNIKILGQIWCLLLLLYFRRMLRLVSCLFHLINKRSSLFRSNEITQPKSKDGLPFSMTCYMHYLITPVLSFLICSSHVVGSMFSIVYFDRNLLFSCCRKYVFDSVFWQIWTMYKGGLRNYCSILFDIIVHFSPLRDWHILPKITHDKL
jgi:hypothetical protein